MLKYQLKKWSRLFMRGDHLQEARQLTKALTERRLVLQKEGRILAMVAHGGLTVITYTKI